MSCAPTSSVLRHCGVFDGTHFSAYVYCAHSSRCSSDRDPASLVTSNSVASPTSAFIDEIVTARLPWMEKLTLVPSSGIPKKFPVGLKRPWVQKFVFWFDVDHAHDHSRLPVLMCRGLNPRDNASEDFFEDVPFQLDPERKVWLSSYKRAHVMQILSSSAWRPRAGGRPSPQRRRFCHHQGLPRSSRSSYCVS